jgi:hypothetical protein
MQQIGNRYYETITCANCGCKEEYDAESPERLKQGIRDMGKCVFTAIQRVNTSANVSAMISPAEKKKNVSRKKGSWLICSASNHNGPVTTKPGL